MATIDAIIVFFLLGVFLEPRFSGCFVWTKSSALANISPHATETDVPRNTKYGSPHPLNVASGCRIRLYRQAAGLTLAELGARCGITFQQVQKYQTGANRITFARLVELANALGSDVCDLIGSLDTPNLADRLPKQIAWLAEPRGQRITSGLRENLFPGATRSRSYACAAVGEQPIETPVTLTVPH
jgi:transcriptional regulator with XRE-family HTH domain